MKFEINVDNSDQVVQICRRLDGIPLAIELAAARVRTLSVHQIAERLDDRFALLTRGSRTSLPRQQTLRALIDWSWDLMSDTERVMLARLSVFSGGCTLEAAEAVCRDVESAGYRVLGVGHNRVPTLNTQHPTPIQEDDVLDLVSQLVDKSMVITEGRGAESRFKLLDSVRQYAHERLMESGEEPIVQRRHSAWALALAEEAEPHVEGPGMQEWLDRLETEHGNIRAALAFAQGVEMLRLSVAMHRFWFVRGFLKEGREWIENALRSASDADRMLRASALNRAGILAWRQGDFDAARPHLTANLELRLTEGDRSGAAAALNNLGLVADDEGDHAAARNYYEQAANIYRELGDRSHIGMALANLGACLIDQGDLVAAGAASHEFLVVAKEIKDPWCLATAWNNLGEIAYRRGEWEPAADLLRRSLRAGSELGDKALSVQPMMTIGRLYLAQGFAERGVELMAAAESYMSAEGIFQRRQDLLDQEHVKENAASLLGQDVFAECWDRGAAMSPEAALKLALDGDTVGR